MSQSHALNVAHKPRKRSRLPTPEQDVGAIVSQPCDYLSGIAGSP
jgi:hypothetical protein